ncbi:MAG TPA: HIT domain-containing protein [Thermomicrobiales bacterium]|jgi:ATP adenylyltransferase|nr:HIT domain-containing protein [Thermomicrobiales bacterium]HQZ89880.1 HIT domain-containing protein [Thermomicrobiales bacterium]
MTYVDGARQPGCVFCNALAAGDDREMLILHRGDHGFIMLNLYPYNSGHSMVVPYQHVSTIENLDAASRAELLELASLAVEASRRILRCDGFNVGLNLGSVAGAGVADHLHMHVVPRWTGDANFMPILGDTMVMPELLPATYARMRGEIEALVGERAGHPINSAGTIIVVPGEGVVLASDDTAGLSFPVTPICPPETVSDAVLRAAGGALGGSTTIAGWAGMIDDTPAGRAVYLLATSLPGSASVPGAIVLPPESVANALTDPALIELFQKQLPIVTRLAGSM